MDYKTILATIEPAYIFWGLYALGALIFFPFGFAVVRKGSDREGPGSVLSALFWALLWAALWPSRYGGWWAIRNYKDAVRSDNELLEARRTRPAGSLTDKF